MKWKPVADAFMEILRSETFDHAHLDVRENVRFEGRHLARWVHENYGDVGCALAIELKKVFMDEWTGRVDRHHLQDLAGTVQGAMPPVVDVIREDR